MPTLKVSQNGFTSGYAGKGGAREKKRTRNSGWSDGAARRNTAFLRSIDCAELDGDGYAFTFTVREIPESAEIYAAAMKRLTERLGHGGCIRWHRVMELTKRRRPHLHGSVYFPEGWTPPGAPISDIASPALRAAWVHGWLVQQWREVAGEWGTGYAAQDVKAIDGAEGWLGYCSKHAARGAKHYQRQGMPPGWESMPQVWSKSRGWPVLPPIELNLSDQEFVRLRRLSKRHAMSQRRTALRRAERYGDVDQAKRARRSLAYLRRSLKCTDRGLSRVRGISEWCPQDMAFPLALAAGWSGEMVTT